MADDETLADTSPSFSSTGQDESTLGAGAGVVQDITDAPEISSVLPPSPAAPTFTTVAPPTTTAATTITLPMTITSI